MKINIENILEEYKNYGQDKLIVVSGKDAFTFCSYMTLDVQQRMGYPTFLFCENYTPVNRDKIYHIETDKLDIDYK